MEDDDVICFQSLGLMHCEELYLSATYNVKELIASFDGLERIGQVIVIERISSQQEDGLVAWYTFHDAADGGGIVCLVILIEEHVSLDSLIECGNAFLDLDWVLLNEVG